MALYLVEIRIESDSLAVARDRTRAALAWLRSDSGCPDDGLTTVRIWHENNRDNTLTEDSYL